MASDAQRALAASIGSLTRWSRIHGADARTEQLAPARAGMRSRLERQALDEAGHDLSREDLDAAVDRLRRAHYRRMALASVKSRSRA